MPGPVRQPLGLYLTQTAKAISRAFDDALAAAGGSTPVWLVLLSLKTRAVSNQRELAEAVGIQGATLTHHLNAMESDGLLSRRRDPSNRRVHLVELTDEGEAMFHRLRKAATAFDKQLHGDLANTEVSEFKRTLAQLRENASALPNP
ncbi:MarR family winged helix-turn-helix transcriptional regulator [Saccharopolyspora phatthalungensis]|uniref:MarR family transcriptional regulator for hemolysin n=1 Tax=Saccharopolyspora phatthalungensis TaxID=664693 RepID=A0A840QBN4_9PSEU|nr:MarR family winged helix-turn-helix transcriptional regulator [Saccharopolyspora phatthalungensis]MBB5157211.1 MarR family transcriptional regulator for hemolysin [Saccharopolyspora phatthalungensis]